MDGIVAVLVLALIFGPFLGVGFGIGWAVRGRRDRTSLALGMSRFKRQDALVDQIQRDAYEHMVLDPAAPLPVIIIDSIRNSEAEERREIAAAGVDPMTADHALADPSTKSPFAHLNVQKPTNPGAVYPPQVPAPFPTPFPTAPAVGPVAPPVDTSPPAPGPDYLSSQPYLAAPPQPSPQPPTVP